ncbi:cytochrome c biogenesis protein CcdA [Lentisphaerota bacterium ZTH]|nr:thioredoxin family protein [Lentisphaerota bacterium]WET06040.1 cytochrome c biogenesis protein CcdA [Lentisphaerota bacterium ZTH]
MKTGTILWALLIVVFFTAAGVKAQFADPFKWDVSRENQKISVKVKIPAGHYLYQEQTKVMVTGNTGQACIASETPKAILHEDQLLGKTRVFMGPGTIDWTFDCSGLQTPLKIDIAYQGCKEKTADSQAICFVPSQKELTIKGDNKATAETETTRKASYETGEIPPALKSLLDKFKISRTAAGVMDKKEFSMFLVGKTKMTDLLADKGTFLIILIILGGGLILNLTPCVLPMIPINLAIIGAGPKADSKAKGFIRGGAYGLGITLSYGILGLLAVLTGARFGSLNSSVWFNIGIAVVFLILGLAMFDLIIIDFSKYGHKITPQNSQSGKVITALIMGVIAALLAGACVAPIVIAVLIYSTKIYADGNMAGLFLPFLLGLGMGLPWPFAGAGLALIPKPGQWMVRIKHLFGIIILAAAVYYCYTGISLVETTGRGVASTGQNAKLANKLQRALDQKKPVLVDVWASWCKNCLYMNSTVFKNSEIKKQLKDFIFVKYQAEKIQGPDVKPVLDYFNVKGLPTYIILEPKK